jgi:hypothetical protein
MLNISRPKLLAITAAAIALVSAPSPTKPENCTNFQGTANFSQALFLTATSNAPSGARGMAQFLVVNDSGTNYEMLFVRTFALPDNAYTVQVTDDTGVSYDLGTLNVTTRTNFDDDFGFGDDGGDDHHFGDFGGGWGGFTNFWNGSNFCGGYTNGGYSGWGQGGQFRSLDWPGPSGYSRWSNNGFSRSWHHWLQQCSSGNSNWTNLFNLGACTNLCTFATNAYRWYTNTLSVGRGSFVLPDGLSQSNAASIAISDADGNVMLTGDFASISNSTICFTEVAKIRPVTKATAKGKATITYQRYNSKAAGTFRLQAGGLTPLKKLYLTANGTNTISVVTGSMGYLDVRTFPRVRVLTLQDVVATDTSSNVVFRVNF